jgi:cupin fold WbuC family metalloprotein
VRTIHQGLLDDLLAQAARSDRLRVPYRFHAHEEPVQRMLNAILPGSYITPHKHENPDKVELISVLVGTAAVVHYTDAGEIAEVFVLRRNGPVYGVDIPPRVYHNFVALTPCVILEIIQGPYVAETHKKFAPWAPLEDSPEAAAYLARLEGLIRAREEAL